MKELCLGPLGLLGGGVLGLLLPHGHQHVLHLLPLLLATLVLAKTFLQELQATLFLANFKQLLGSLLVGGEANHLSDQSSHVHNVLAREFSRLLLVAGVGGDLVPLIHAHDHLILEAMGGVRSRTRHFQRFSVSCRSESSNISFAFFL